METHSCKFCRRSFPSGRSLGGHMRSHVMMITSLHNGDSSQSGYGLRENPKKSWRFDEAGENISKPKLCEKKHCSEPEVEDEDEEEDSMEIQKEGEVRRRKSKLIETISASSFPLPSSPEYGALCLMMLSRASSPVSDSLDVLKRSKSDFFKIGLKKVEFFPSDSGFPLDGEDAESKKGMKRIKSSGDDFDSGIENLYKRSRYNCAICNKSFHSYQALGGHCASHKKNKQDTSSVSRPAEEPFSGKFRTHRCLICKKIFSSGQALGGHKKSHLMSDNAISSSSSSSPPPPSQLLKLLRLSGGIRRRNHSISIFLLRILEFVMGLNLMDAVLKSK
ncbi:Zinc finger protein ZAT9 [Platanthera guangdongensis]|uniref:Zinc finger protein ZAT9 n=1 Tax=Platanthera guangdongensis TaxID=2320717 RepID=A0ABR2LKK9_9ASPA